jgi:D-alanyl-D-alanine carboxypeptidase
MRSRDSYFSASVSKAVQTIIADADLPGAAIAVAIDGNFITLGVGFRDLDRRQPLPDDARFYIYSVTKMLLAMATLRLVEQERLALDQPIQTLLSEVALDRPITIRQLLNHTSGLPDYGAMPAYNLALKSDPANPWGVSEFLDSTLAQGYLFPPGQGWAYSNLGYLLVRLTIERLTQRSLQDTLEHLVFSPLQLSRTTVAGSLASANVLTPGYSAGLDQDGMLRDITGRYHPGWVAHGVAISTASELALLVSALCSGQLLSPESLALMLEPVAVPGNHFPFVRPAYGLGLMIDLESPHGCAIGHAGGGPGYSTSAFQFPDVAGYPVTIVTLTNQDEPSVATKVVFALADTVRQLIEGGMGDQI